jgi:hypothetical protein
MLRTEEHQYSGDFQLAGSSSLAFLLHVEQRLISLAVIQS